MESGYCSGWIPVATLDMSCIEATYLATRPERDPEELAEAIAREQSLEILDELIPEAIRRRFLGRVLDVQPIDDHRWSLRIAYPAHLASGQLGQLMQLLYGNVSFYPRIRLSELALPDALTASFKGPLGGIEEIRKYISVDDRALLLTVLKPRGSSPEQLAQLAERFALGGGDILKDDQNLVEDSMERFVARVAACADAVERARQRTGRACLYLPHVAGAGPHLHRQLDWVAERGLAGVVMCPWFIGLETASAAAAGHGLMWLAHPAGAGVYTQADDRGMAAEIVFGQLPRLAGADLTIFPGSGGRISLGGPDDDRRIARELTRPRSLLAPSLPCTGGGKTLEQCAEVAETLGQDCAIVVGGDLLRRGERLGPFTARTIDELTACGKKI
jgi:ribulose-bisphosphate carboxylase large chain